MAKNTATKSKISSKTLLVTGIALGVGGIALALFPFWGRQYQHTYIQCHDGSSIVTPAGDCRTAREWKTYARIKCQKAVNPNTGKRGVNTFKIGELCRPQSR